MKIFRIMDDINWDDVEPTLLKSLLNRNISSVNIKYGYEFIFPLIPIIIMNKEDYENFRKHFTSIWEFIVQNTVIYPKQESREIVQEEKSLFMENELEDESNEMYLFNNILNVEELEKCDENNMNKFIKKRLNETQKWKYDTKKYIQLPDLNIKYIPNPELSRKSILKQYDEYLLRKKQAEINKEGKEKEEKKPREPWYRQVSNKLKEYKKTNFDDLNSKKFNDYDYDDEDDDDDEDDYDYDEEGDEDEEDDDDMSSEDDYEDSGNYGGNGFVQI